MERIRRFRTIAAMYMSSVDLLLVGYTEDLKKPHNRQKWDVGCLPGTSTHTLVTLIYIKSLSHCLQLLSLFIFPHYQRTPLHIAARENYERTVECLADKGAGINIKDKDGVSTCEVSPIPRLLKH